jgi:tetratricopeptide (TPR) repeat protein
MDDTTRLPDDSRSIRSGSRIAHYEVISALGAGGMGHVYLATDGRLGRKVALKLLSKPASAYSERLERFLIEARTVSALNHPNIVTVYETGDSAYGRYIAMEFVEGTTLRPLIRASRSVAEAIDLAIQAAQAIAVAHAAKIVHRDLKPENVMVRPDGYVKVLDFGLARLSSADTNEATQTAIGVVVGTLQYMSPEQGAGLDVDLRSDIFSLGLVFYELLAGRHPFASPSPRAVFDAIAVETAAPPSRFNPAVPPELDALVGKMLQKDPGLRPTATEVVDALTGWRHGSHTAPRARMPGRAQRRFVGRKGQLGELMEAFGSAAAGQGVLLCVPGEPGLGKTALVDEFLETLEQSHESCAVGRGACVERLAGASAYLPVIEVLENLRRFDPTHRIESAMRTLAPSWLLQITSDTGSASDAIDRVAINQDRLRFELITLFQKLAQERPLVLCIEDLHWADVSTIDVVAQLAGQLRELGVLLLTTYRDSDMQVSRHPFLKLKLDLTARGLCREVRLDYLSQSDVEQYVSLQFPGSRVPADFAARLHARTEGHPLFVTDLLRYLCDNRAVAQENGAWTVTPRFAALESRLPQSVESMVELKISQLSEADLPILIAASVQGVEFDSAVVAASTEIDALTIEEALERVERTHALIRLVEERELADRTLSCRYRFAHALYPAALYARLRPTRRVALNAAVARTLANAWGDRRTEIAGELAELFERARDHSNAAQFYFAASQNASTLFAYSEAALLARRGLAMALMLPPLPERAMLELPLQMMLGGSIALSAGYAHAEVRSCFARARELTQAAGDSVPLFSAMWGQWFFSCATADCAGARGLSEQMLRVATATQDRDLLAAAHYALGVVSELEGNHASVLEHSAEVIAAFAVPDGHRARLQRFMVDPVLSARGQHARALGFLGQPAQCDTELGQLLEWVRRGDFDPRSRCDLVVAACVCHQLLGNADAIPETAAVGIALGAKYGLVLELHCANLLNGWALAATGSPLDGVNQIRSCQALFNAVGLGMFVGTALPAYLAEALLLAGQANDALAAVEGGIAFAETHGHRYFEPELLRVRGEIAFADGHTGEAESWYRRALERARQQSSRAHELKAALSLSKVLEHDGRSDEARAVVQAVHGSFVDGFETADLRRARELLRTRA